MHFDARADEYAAARPPYPPALWERIRALGLLRPGRRALDLGAGAGEVTGHLLEAGLHVTAVEPGPHLAGLLHAAHPAADVVIARAEEAEVAPTSVDLVVAATSIHWMDIDVVLPKIHAWLRPKGRFVVWRNVFGDSAFEATPFRRRVAEIVAARQTTRSGPPRKTSRR